jgi:hypothetical protein
VNHDPIPTVEIHQEAVGNLIEALRVRDAKITRLMDDLETTRDLLAVAAAESEWLAAKLFTISKRADTETREFVAGLLRIRKEKFSAEAVARDA